MKSKFLVISILGFALSSWAAEDVSPTPTPTPEATVPLERKVEVLTQEVARLKAGRELFPEANRSDFGFGPAASKVYRASHGVSLGGYGEMLYENFRGANESGAPSSLKDEIDFLRAVLYAGYKFNDKFLFNSEIEFEHGSTGQGGVVSVEFAYLDYLWKPYLSFRAGLLLLPMGFINEQHEPTIYLGSKRPETERQIIPSTWRENGAGLFGSHKNFSYKAYVVNGFDAVGNSPTTGYLSSGIRSGRQNGAAALAEDWAFVGRVDYDGCPGLLIGTSGYIGNAGQGNQTTTSASITAQTAIVEGHADYRFQGVEFRGLLAYAHVGDAARINDAKSLTGTDTVGEDLLGYYFQLGYDVLSLHPTEQNLIPFVRYEWLDTHFGVPTGFTKNPARERKIITLGASYKPIPNIVAKVDYQFNRNEGGTGVDQFNVGLGYVF